MLSDKDESMQLLFNLVATQPDIFSKFHGGGKYGEIIIRRIVERKLPVVCYYDSNKWFNPVVKSLLDTNGVRLYDIRRDSIEKIIKELSPVRLFSPQYNNELASIKNIIDIYGTIHGLRGLETPWDSDMINYKPNRNFLRYIYYSIFKEKRVKKEYDYIRHILNNPNCHVITVSNHSASSIKCYFPEFKQLNIPVFYSPSTSIESISETKYIEKYYLIVSANRPGKNALRAIRAFDRLFDNGYLDNVKVRITGASSWDAYRYKSKHADKFIFHGFVDEHELEQLYHDAYCLVYPSLNEGFGYPPLEAMHYGIPVITSSYSSIPEVCGDAVLFFNPMSVEEIMSRIILIDDNERHNNYSLRAFKRYKEIKMLQERDLDALIDYLYKQ